MEMLRREVKRVFTLYGSGREVHIFASTRFDAKDASAWLLIIVR